MLTTGVCKVQLSDFKEKTSIAFHKHQKLSLHQVPTATWMLFLIVTALKFPPINLKHLPCSPLQEPPLQRRCRHLLSGLTLLSLFITEAPLITQFSMQGNKENHWPFGSEGQLNGHRELTNKLELALSFSVTRKSGFRGQLVCEPVCVNEWMRCSNPQWCCFIVAAGEQHSGSWVLIFYFMNKSPWKLQQWTWVHFFYRQEGVLLPCQQIWFSYTSVSATKTPPTLRAFSS